MCLREKPASQAHMMLYHCPHYERASKGRHFFPPHRGEIVVGFINPLLEQKIVGIMYVNEIHGSLQILR